MTNFFYRCKRNNETSKGYITAKDMQDAAKKLEAQGYIVLGLKEEKNASNNFSLKYELIPFNIKEKKDFFNSLYRQYKAGIPSLEIFDNILSTSSSENIKTLCFNIIRKLQKGCTFQEVTQTYSKTIGEVEAALIIAGDKSGKLEEILYRITLNIQQQEKIKSNLISQLTYPVIIFNLILFSCLVFIFFVFPVFQSLNADSDLCIMKTLTNAIIKIGLIFGALYITIFSISKNKNLLKKITNSLFKIKNIKEIIEIYYFSNFFYTLSLASESGISMPEAINLANKTINSKEINETLNKTQKMIEDGCEVATALGVAGIFSEYAISQTSSGEKTGELTTALEDIAKDYQETYTTKTNVFVKSIEPIMIIIAAIFILIICIKFYSTYFESLFSAL